MQEKLNELTKEELVNECLTLMGERNKRLKADIEVTNANKLLEAEKYSIIYWTSFNIR